MSDITDLILKIIGATTGIVGTILSVRLTIINSKENTRLKIADPDFDFTTNESVVITGTGCKPNNIVILINKIIPGYCYIQTKTGNPTKNGSWTAISQLDIVKNERYIYALSIPRTKFGVFKQVFDEYKNLQLSNLEDKLTKMRIKYDLSAPIRMKRMTPQVAEELRNHNSNRI